MWKKKKNPIYIYNEFEEKKENNIWREGRGRTKSIEYGGDKIQKTTKETVVRTTTKKAMQESSAEEKIDTKQMKVTTVNSTVKEHFANSKHKVFHQHL